MKELSFLLSLKNNLSAPLGKAQQAVEGFAKKSKAAFKNIGVGAAGLWGVVQGVKGLLGPADRVQQALNELATRNIDSAVLDAIYQAAQRFSTQFGKSAADFIASGATIKQVLSGLADNELPRAAVAINTLAVATKSSAEQAASYVSEMANTYRTAVSDMGNVPFAEMMAGKAAYMAASFGNSLNEIREMVKSAGAAAGGAGVGMNEQLSVLGVLGKSNGAAAGGQYAAFLKNAVAGGRQLGVSLTDAQGKLLSFPDILQKLQARLGNTIDGNARAQTLLNRAFGEGAQALTAAWGQADILRKHMRDMGNTQGLDRATAMAMKMANIWERVDEVWRRIRVALGMHLIPAISPLINYGIHAGETFAKWLDMFPNIGRWIGYITLTVLSLGAAGAAANIVVGVSKFIWMGLTRIWKVARATALALMWAINLKARALQIARVAATAYGATLRLMRVAVLAMTLAWRTSSAALLLQRGALMISSVAMRAFGIATALAGGAMQLLMSPVTLIIAGIALLAAGVWYAVTHWKTLKAALLDSAVFHWITEQVTALGDAFSDVWASVKLGWEMVVNRFTGLSPVRAFVGFADSIRNVFSGLWDTLISSFGKTYNWIVSRLNKIPGVSIDLKPVSQSDAPGTGIAAPAGLNAPRLERGGLGKAITGGAGKITDNSKNNHINTVNIFPKNAETFDALLESQELAAG